MILGRTAISRPGYKPYPRYVGQTEIAGHYWLKKSSSPNLSNEDTLVLDAYSLGIGRIMCIFSRTLTVRSDWSKK
jgi:hypothetical protein